MMSSRKIACYLIALVLYAPSTPVGAGEDDFILVDRMPKILGEKMRSQILEDEDRGIEIVQDIYSEQFAHAWVETFVLMVSCLDKPEEPRPSPHIVAIKYLPKKPESFAIATLHDIYKEVYLDAGEERIRLYEDVSGHEMVELSERYMPKCIRI